MDASNSSFSDVDFAIMQKLPSISIENSKVVFSFPEITKQKAEKFILAAGNKLALVAKRMNLKSAIARGKHEDYEFLAALATLSTDSSNLLHENITVYSFATKEEPFKMTANQPIIQDPFNTPVAKELDISWDDVNKSNDAIWVICQRTQKVLFCNLAAILANGNKPPTEILANDISVLWEEENLRNLTELVQNTPGWLRDHYNRGMRWERNEEDGQVIWCRRKYDFNVDYHPITYLGTEARFEHVKNAVPV